MMNSVGQTPMHNSGILKNPYNQSPQYLAVGGQHLVPRNLSGDTLAQLPSNGGGEMIGSMAVLSPTVMQPVPRNSHTNGQQLRSSSHDAMMGHGMMQYGYLPPPIPMQLMPPPGNAPAPISPPLQPMTANNPNLPKQKFTSLEQPTRKAVALNNMMNHQRAAMYQAQAPQVQPQQYYAYQQQQQQHHQQQQQQQFYQQQQQQQYPSQPQSPPTPTPSQYQQQTP